MSPGSSALIRNHAHRRHDVHQHPAGEVHRYALARGAAELGDQVHQGLPALPDAAANLVIRTRRISLHLEEKQFALGQQAGVGVAHRVQSNIDRPVSEVPALRPVVKLLGIFCGRPKGVLDPVEALVDRCEEKVLLRREQAKDVSLAILSVEVPCKPYAANSATAARSTCCRRASADCRALAPEGRTLVATDM